MAWSKAQVKDIFTRAAQANGLDVGLSLAQINQESGFDANAVSSAGAKGAAQFMPGTWQTYGNGSPFDPNAASIAWAKYMRHLLAMFNGRWDLALAGYNGGENRQVLRTALATGKPLTAFPKCGSWSNTCVHSQSWDYSRIIMAAAGRSQPAANIAQAVPLDSGAGVSDTSAPDVFTDSGPVQTTGEDLNAGSGLAGNSTLILLGLAAVAAFFLLKD